MIKKLSYEDAKYKLDEIFRDVYGRPLEEGSGITQEMAKSILDGMDRLRVERLE